MKPEHTEVVSQSLSMKTLLEELDQLATQKMPVLLLGEDGTGKSRLAKRLAAKGPRAETELVEVSYDPKPTETARDELFGAEAEHPGALAGAHGGTMLIDELRSLTLAAQDELLEFLESGKVRGRECDVRVVLLSHVRDPQALRDLIENETVRPKFLQEGRFAVLTVPPLRERRAELPALCQAILQEEADIWGNKTPSLTDEALLALSSYHWPKNTSELKKVLKKAMRACEGQPITTQHLPEEVRG